MDSSQDGSPYWVKEKDRKEHVDVLVVDGYVDEPSLLGVPPYVSPEPRMLVGVAEELGLSWEYVPVDEYRVDGLPLGDIVLIHGGVTVPGTYLSGTPLSEREAGEIAGEPGETYLGGPLARYGSVSGYDHQVEKDLAAYFFDSLYGEGVDRWLEPGERERWSLLGAEAVGRHPMPAEHLMAEIETYRGCPRYFTGGCSFCTEPDYGEPVFREQADILDEIEALYENRVRHFRLGGQSCILSYKAEKVGEEETPVPVPGELKELLKGVWERCPEIEVLHVDNANPAVIDEYPEESRRILEHLVEFTSAGNVLALGMESADLDVVEKNNLNSTPVQVEEAVKMINEVGRERGENGMPQLLPGLNFLGGLMGETRETYDRNLEFLKRLREEEYFLRRINIRQVISEDDNFEVKYKRKFKRFKKEVRETIDRPILREMVPEGTVLRDVLMEKREGKTTFGRQIATYPLLVGVEYPLELGEFYDVKITDHGYRSVTGIHQPFDLSGASFKELKAVPGIGKKRAGKIFTEKPGDEGELKDLIEDEDAFQRVMWYVDVG